MRQARKLLPVLHVRSFLPLKLLLQNARAFQVCDVVERFTCYIRLSIICVIYAYTGYLPDAKSCKACSVGSFYQPGTVTRNATCRLCSAGSISNTEGALLCMRITIYNSSFRICSILVNRVGNIVLLRCVTNM